MVSNQISKASLTTCTAKIDKVNLKIEEQKHNILGALFTPIIQTSIKTRMEKGVEQFIEKKIHQLIRQLNDWFRTRPFETMMKKGNEGIQVAQRKRGERKEEKLKKEIHSSLSSEKKEKKEKRSHDSKEKKKHAGQARDQEKITGILNDDAKDHAKQQKHTGEVKKEHDHHVETDDKSKSIPPNTNEMAVPKKNHLKRRREVQRLMIL